jgi:outer membrane protein assembly factor BamB
MISSISRRAYLVVVGLVCVLASVSSAQLNTWEQAGMEVAWDFQAPTEPARSGDVFVTSHVSAKQKRTVYEVHHKGGPTTVFAAGQVDREGRRLDAAAAAFQADVELRTLKALGHDDAKIEVREVPQVSLLMQTGSGQLLLLDGETGELRWSVVIGKHNLTNLQPALGEDHVIAINGSTLYIINVETGKLEAERRLHGIPDAGPTIAGEQAIVPIMGRPFEVYSLSEGQLNQTPMFRASFGRVTGNPVATPLSVIWATDRGHVFMANPTTAIPTARIEARKGIVGTPAFVPPDWVVFGVEDGYVMAVELQQQVIQWEFFSGQSLSEPPYALDKAVYVPTSQNELIKLNASDGQLQWETTGVRRVVSGLRDRLYCESTNGDLVTLDTKAGRLLGRAPLSRQDHMLTNTLTDRIYLVRGNGLIECLRATGARWPTLHLPLPQLDTDEQTPVDGESETAISEPDSLGDSDDAGDISEDDPFADNATPADSMDEEDPFAAGDDQDPFATDAGDEQNPFAEGTSDDAGSDDADEEEDPFGADSDEEDPFAESDDDPFANLGEDPFG